MASSGLVPYVFTNAQLTDIRRFCGFEAYGTGTVLFPQPWIMKRYLALEYRMKSMTTDEATVITSIILPNLYTLELAIPGASQNLDTDAAGPWKHNRREVRDRVGLFNYWRKYLCSFMGIDPGPGITGSGSSRAMIV